VRLGCKYDPNHIVISISACELPMRLQTLSFQWKIIEIASFFAGSVGDNLSRTWGDDENSGSGIIL
jgi:hypothetical protein